MGMLLAMVCTDEMILAAVPLGEAVSLTPTRLGLLLEANCFKP